MIASDQELKVTLERIARFQEQVAHLRRVETNPENYHGAVSDFSQKSTVCNSMCGNI